MCAEFYIVIVLLQVYCTVMKINDIEWSKLKKEAAEHRSSVLFHCSVIIDVLPDCNCTPSSNNVIMWQQRWIWDNKSQFDANWAFSREIRNI